MASDTDDSIPLSWVLLFLLLVIAIGAGVILYVGGSVLP